jgi:CheY-like chemotaxis protein
MDEILCTDKQLMDEVTALRLQIAGHKSTEAALVAENERLRTFLAEIPGESAAENLPSLPDRGGAGEIDTGCVTAKKTSATGCHKGGAILVMDDELIIRKIIVKMLECLGYQVTACANGAEAVALYKAAKDSGRQFEAVIMDLAIPGGMGGKEAAQYILAIDPDARLVVSSGYYNDPVMADFKSYGFCSVMPKPYKISDIAEVLSDLPPKNTVDSSVKTIFRRLRW